MHRQLSTRQTTVEGLACRTTQACLFNSLIHSPLCYLADILRPFLRRYQPLQEVPRIHPPLRQAVQRQEAK